MILGSLNNTSRIESMNVKFKTFFDFVAENDLYNMDLGEIEIEGRDLYLINAETQGKLPEEVVLEGHRKYVDIHLLLSGSEAIGWKARNDAEEIFKAYNEDNDVTLFTDDADEIINLQPGQFMILFPEDLHGSEVGEGTIRKVVAKIKVD